MGLYTKKIIQEGKEFKRIPPVNLSAESRYHFEINAKYKCPDLYVYFFKKVYLLPDSTLFLFKIWPLAISFLYYKKRIRLHSVKGIVDIRRSWRQLKFERLEKPYLIIHDPWTLNYYHWMTQALPRLMMALKTKSSFTLLLPRDHCKPFHEESLRILGVNSWINFDVGETFYDVRNLMYPSHDIQIGDYHDELIKELATALQQKIGIRKKNNYLFIHRISKRARKIVNEDQVLAVFLKWGFSIVNFENFNFEEQRVMAGNATILAGVHGAGLTNMLFMEKGSHVLELTTILNGEQYYYYTLSNALGHHYYYQLCKPDIVDKSIQEANLIVDVEVLNRNIELMIKSVHA